MSSSSAAAAAAAAAGAGLTGAHCVADRLARFMQRHALTDVKVAQQLAWPLEQLREYLASENRNRQKVALDVRTHTGICASVRVAIYIAVDMCHVYVYACVSMVVMGGSVSTWIGGRQLVSL